MSLTLGDIILFLGADDSRLDGVLKGVEGKTQSWVNSLGGKLAIGLGAIVTTAIGSATALGLAAFKAGGELDAAYDTLLIKTGASGEALQQLQEDFKAVFSSAPTDAQPLADVLSVLHERTTMVGEDNQNLSKQLLESSRIMGGDAKVNAELYTRMMGDWSISNEDASQTLDKVFVASQKTGIGMDRLMSLAVQFGSPMRLMGFTLDDTIALLSKWEKEGVNTELVMGSLRIAAGKFADEGKPLRESLLGTFEAIKNNTDATAALNLGMDVFGARAGPDMVAAIREGRFEFEDLLLVLQDTDGAILDTAKETMDWGEKLQMLKNKATLALEPLGMKLMDVASMLLDKAGPALDWFGGVLEDYVVPAVDTLAESLNLLLEGDVQGALANLFGEETAGKIMAFAQTVNTFINDTLIPFVQEHWPEIKAALIGIGAALAAAGIVSVVTGIVAAIGSLLTPVGAIIALVALLGAAWAGNWGGIQEKTQAVIEWLKMALDTGMQFINDFVNGKLGVLSQIFAAAWQNVQLIFQAFQAAFSGDWYRFGELLRQAWDNSWNLIKTILSNAWENIKSAVKTGIDSVKSFFTDTDWGQVGRNILEGIANGIRNGLSIIADAAQEAAQNALEAAKGFLGIKSPSTVFAKEVGEPSAEGFGVGFARRMDDLGKGAGQEALNSFGDAPAMGGGGGGSIQLQYVDQRFISLSDEFEAERVLRPIIERIFRGMGPAGAAA